MSVERYRIAGLKVEMDVRYALLKTRSEKYAFRFDGEPDLTIGTTDERIAAIKREYPNLSDETCEYMSTGSMFYKRLLTFDGFLLHSSCIAYDGKAYLITADSGTGKSTHTALWKRYLGDAVTMINDDKPAVRLLDNAFFACGTPWSGKTDQNTDLAVPVGGVAMLHRGEVNTIRPAVPAETVRFLLRQTAFPAKRENTDLMAALFDRFIRAVPVWHLECDMSEDAVAVSFEAMTGKKYVKGNKV